MQWHRPHAGDVVWIRGRRWRVAASRSNGSTTRLDVTTHDARRTFLSPFDRPLDLQRSARPIRVRPQRARAALAGLAGRAFGARTLCAAIDADVAILPHQLEPALAMLAGRRRLLIADEVGLGKTIQAGLIVAEIQRRDPGARLLVLVPAALVEQWIAELGDRFALNCRVAGRAGLDRHARELAAGESPWHGPGLWIASLDFLKQRHVVESMPARPWDLVVVDEAHAACGRSDRQALVDHIGRRSRRVVLLTATPHSGDEERFARLLQAGQLDQDDITIFRRGRADLGMAQRRRVAWHGVTLSTAEGQVLAALEAFERAVLRAAGHSGRDNARLLLGVFRKRALSTMAALARSIDRRAAFLAATADDPGNDGLTQRAFEFDAGPDDDVASAEDVAGLQARSGLTAAAERSWLKRLGHLAARAGDEESKVSRLVRLLGRTGEPAVVFTEFRDSLTVVVERLRLVRPLTVLHGGLTPAERAEALRRFQSQAVSLLVATDVAGQGVNLHHRCRWVISLELPWNPARLEQRIGRVDRIGQRKCVHLTLLVARHPSEATLLSHLARRVTAARRPLGRSALIDVPPPEHAIRAAVIDRAPIEAPATPVPAPALCTTFARVARHAARDLAIRRALARCWRGPQLPGRLLVALGRTPAMAGLHRGGIALVVSVPLFDESGALVELCLRALRTGDHSLTPDLIEAARRTAVESLAPRIRRVRHLAEAAARTMAARELAIAGELRRRLQGEAQPGLFDARAVRSYEEARMISAEIDRDRDLALDRLRARTGISAGRAVLELVIRGRR